MMTDLMKNGKKKPPLSVTSRYPDPEPGSNYSGSEPEPQVEKITEPQFEKILFTGAGALAQKNYCPEPKLKKVIYLSRGPEKLLAGAESGGLFIP